LDRINRIGRIEEREARAPAQTVIGPDEDAVSVRFGGELKCVVVGERAGSGGVGDGDATAVPLSSLFVNFRADPDSPISGLTPIPPTSMLVVFLE
jgi:hypothetical protein